MHYWVPDEDERAELLAILSTSEEETREAGGRY
jgi:hypothetical protein